MTFRRTIIMANITIALLLATGCKTIPDRDAQDVIPVTDSFIRHPLQTMGPHKDILTERWWEIYGDEELNHIVETALLHNTDIEQTRKRFEQAAAVANRTMSDLLPDLTIGAGRETTRGDNRTASDFSLSGAAGYEIDIWGKNRARYNADRLEAQASIEDIRTLAITVSASIVENWLRLAALREESSLLQKQIETNKMVLELQHKRYAGGAAEALDVLQQKEVLARAEALMPDIKAEQEITLQQIAILSGQNPSSSPPLTVSALAAPLPLPDTGIPARLLANRPDITASWLRVEAANWNTRAAWANRLPSIDIGASYLSSATKVSNLLDVWLLTLAGNLAAPLIDGGERKAEEARNKALTDEMVVAYKDAVINAIGEVENALTRNHYQTLTIEAVNDQLYAARAVLEQAQISYINGNDSYLSVLSGLLNVQSLERQHIQERRDLTLHRVALYRSLGLKGWTDAALKGPET